MGSTLIAYVSKTGTTREIALEMEKTLKDAGAEAAALPFSEVKSLDRYARVILGAPINGMRLVPEASAFITDHGNELRARDTALFAVSYMHSRGRPLWRKAIEKSVAAAAAECGATATAIFGGRIDSELPGFARFLFGLPNDLSRNLMDLEAVRAWIHGLPKV